jgi:hypothetical protein
MVAVPSVLFVLLFLVIHLLDRSFLLQPMSLSRDGRHAALGYLLFTSLVLVACGQCLMFWIARRYIEFVILLMATGLLIFVAVTPSQDSTHIVASLVLLGFIFLFYAVRLYLADSFWFFVHLMSPIGLAALAAIKPSYGLVQKCVILYAVLLINIDCWCMLGTLWFPRKEEPVQKKRIKQKRRRKKSQPRPGNEM